MLEGWLGRDVHGLLAQAGWEPLQASRLWRPITSSWPRAASPLKRTRCTWALATATVCTGARDRYVRSPMAPVLAIHVLRQPRGAASPRSCSGAGFRFGHATGKGPASSRARQRTRGRLSHRGSRSGGSRQVAVDSGGGGGVCDRALQFGCVELVTHRDHMLLELIVIERLLEHYRASPLLGASMVPSFGRAGSFPARRPARAVFTFEPLPAQRRARRRRAPVNGRSTVSVRWIARVQPLVQPSTRDRTGIGNTFVRFAGARGR
jgi:hypothetical protein